MAKSVAQASLDKLDEFKNIFQTQNFIYLTKKSKTSFWLHRYFKNILIMNIKYKKNILTWKMILWTGLNCVNMKNLVRFFFYLSRCSLQDWLHKDPPREGGPTSLNKSIELHWSLQWTRGCRKNYHPKISKMSSFSHFEDYSKF